MRIHGERPDHVAQTAHNPVDRTRSGRGERGEAVQSASGDRVQVSDDARLLNAAMEAARRAPEAREAAIERARQKWAAGELGQDAERLADRLIDSLLR